MGGHIPQRLHVPKSNSGPTTDTTTKPLGRADKFIGLSLDLLKEKCVITCMLYIIKNIILFLVPKKEKSL